MRIYLIILLVFIGFNSSAQLFYNRTNGLTTPNDPFLSASKALYIPRLADTSLMGGLDTLGAIIYVKTTASFYIRDTILTGVGHRWTKILKAGDIPTPATIYTKDSSIAGTRTINFLNTGALNLSNLLSTTISGARFGIQGATNHLLLLHTEINGHQQSLTLGNIAHEGTIWTSGGASGGNIVLDTNSKMLFPNLLGSGGVEAQDSLLTRNFATGQIRYMNFNRFASSQALIDTAAAIRAAFPTAGSSGVTNVGSGFRVLNSPGAQTLRTIFSSNTITWDSTSNTNGLTGKVDTTVISTKNFVTNTVPWPEEAPISIIYNKQNFDNLADFTPNTAAGTVSLALSGGFVNYTVTSIDWSNFTRLLYTRPTSLPNWTIEVIFKMNTAPGAGTVGFGLGTKKYISQNADVMCYINTTNSGSSGALNISRADGGGFSASGTSSTVSLNDVIRLRVTFVDSSITFSAKNLTTGAAEGSVTYTNTLISGTSPISTIANWGLIGHSSASCTWQIQSVKISSETKRNANLYVIGNSKIQGAFANSFAGRVGAQLNATYPTSVIYAAGGATINDYLNTLEELTYLNGVQYLLCIGSNSVRAGTSLATIQEQYTTLVNILKGGGASVKHIVIPEDSTAGGVGLTAFKNFVANTYPDDYIDIWTGMSTGNKLNSGYNSGDGVHINQAANDYIVSTIVASGEILISPTNRRAQYAVTDNNVKTFGDSIFTYPIQKRLNYIPHWDTDGGSVTGLLQDNGTTSGASVTPLTAITGAQFNVTGFLGINGASGGIIFADRGGSLTTARYAIYASSDRMTFHDPVTALDRMNIDNNGLVGIGTGGQDRKLDILDATNPQLRLTYTDNSAYTDFQTLSTGNLRITPSNGEILIGSSTDQGAFTLQNTGGLRQNGSVQFHAVPVGTTSMNILLQGNTDSTLYKIPASTFVTLVQLNDSLNNNTIIFDNPNLGDTLIVPIDDSTIRIKSLIVNNGLTPAITDSTITIQLGGTLLKNTSISGIEVYDFAFNNVDTFTVLSLGKIRLDGKVEMTNTLDESITESSSSSLNLTTSINYIFTGTTGTFSLPTVDAGIKGRRYKIKNRGSGNLTIDVVGSGTTIYDTAAVASVIIAAGASAEFVLDTTFWNKE